MVVKFTMSVGKSTVLWNGIGAETADPLRIFDAVKSSKCGRIGGDHVFADDFASTILA